MAAPDLSTRDKMFDHLKAIVLEWEQERAGARRRSPDLEFRIRRLEIGVTLLFAEMIARTRPELVAEAEARANDAKTPSEWDQSRVDPPAEPARERPSRDFVGELERMAR